MPNNIFNGANSAYLFGFHVFPCI